MVNGLGRDGINNLTVTKMNSSLREGREGIVNLFNEGVKKVLSQFFWRKYPLER